MVARYRHERGADRLESAVEIFEKIKHRPFAEQRGRLERCLLPPPFAGQQTVAAAAAACQGDGETRAELQGGAATKSPLPFVKH